MYFFLFSSLFSFSFFRFVSFGFVSISFCILRTLFKICFEITFSFMYKIIKVYMLRISTGKNLLISLLTLFNRFDFGIFLNHTLLMVIYKGYISDQGCYELVYSKKRIDSTIIPTNKPSTSYKPENE